MERSEILLSDTLSNMESDRPLLMRRRSSQSRDWRSSSLPFLCAESIRGGAQYTWDASQGSQAKQELSLKEFSLPLLTIISKLFFPISLMEELSPNSQWIERGWQRRSSRLKGSPSARERIGSRTFWTRPPPIRRRQESQLSGQENIPRLIDWRGCPVPLELSNKKNVLTFMRADITSFDIDALVRLTICVKHKMKFILPKPEKKGSPELNHRIGKALFPA